jgi:LDH2 family malate/lactate/ureidoglycolate dehydrogenase
MAGGYNRLVRAAVNQVVRTARDSGPLWTGALILDRVVPYPVLGLWPEIAVRPEDLNRQLDAILRAWGMPGEHAAITASHMVDTDLRGIDSHGSAMLRSYHRALVAGSITTTPAIEVAGRNGSTAVVDGGGGLGHVPAQTGMRLALEICRDTGVGAVAVRNSGHFGAAGVYALMAAEAGCIGIVTSDVVGPAVVPTHGAAAMLGTNPIAFAAPAAANSAFVLDMATSTASHGKVATAWRRGRRIPAGWAIDPRGRPVRNARRAVEDGRLTPLGSTPSLGSYKGYGLAAVVEILSALLAGREGPAGFGTEKARVGHFFLALDPARFRPAGEFGGDLDAMIESLRATEPLDPGRPVMVPGDPERAAASERARSGIPMSRSVLEDIRAVARASGVPFELA